MLIGAVQGEVLCHRIQLDQSPAQAMELQQLQVNEHARIRPLQLALERLERRLFVTAFQEQIREVCCDRRVQRVDASRALQDLATLLGLVQLRKRD